MPPFIILKVLDLVMGLRVPVEIEREGLDLTLHGEVVQYAIRNAIGAVPGKSPLSSRGPGSPRGLSLFLAAWNFSAGNPINPERSRP